jgi:hypothetical protein
MSASALNMGETLAQLDAMLSRSLTKIGEDYIDMHRERDEARATAKRYHDGFERMARATVMAERITPGTERFEQRLESIRAKFL